ncbi:hypothetical protein GGS21DRAFT_543419 [Xylaria nigripes]|nr:hypothetical protein GGS21DRAFT_543419 [Xylaria nigripes]
MTFTLDQAVPGPTRPTSIITSRHDEPRAHVSSPMQFTLSSDRVLLTDGVKDFYEVLHQRDENLEVVYDPSHHHFNIKCWDHEESKVVTIVKEILDQLVQEEIQAGLSYSSKITTLEEWRQNKCQIYGKTEVSEKYRYPRDVASCDFREIWNIPENWSNRGITADMLFPECTLSKIRRLTGAVLVVSCDRCTVYIGASDIETFTIAKRKLDTLLKFFSLASKDATQATKVFLHSEGDKSAKGEYRLLADGSQNLLKGYILDRFDWPDFNKRYTSIYDNGVRVRLNIDKEAWSGGCSLNVVPIFKPSDKERFGAFTKENWNYPAKEAAVLNSNLPGSDVLMKPWPDLRSHQALLRPKIESWVSSIPAPISNETVSYCQTDDLTGGPAPQSALSETNDSTSAIKIDDQQPSVVGPFENLWKDFKLSLMEETKGVRKEQCAQSNLKPSLTVGVPTPRMTESAELNSIPFHSTMNQKTESRAVSISTRHEFDPSILESIRESLASLMAPLTMWPGIVDLRIDLGRFCFMGVKKSHIQVPGVDDDEKYFGLDRIRDELTRRHTTPDKLCFTRVLTTLSAEANYIAHLRDGDGHQIWTRPMQGLSSCYEFTCRSKTADGLEWNFVVDIDAITFTPKVRQFKCEQNCFAVCCTKRAWDFQVVLSVSQNLNDGCTRFAEDLSRSLQVWPVNDQIPELEVSYDRNHDIEILAVRTRNTACYISIEPNKDVQRMHIQEVWEMNRTSKIIQGQHVILKFATYKEHDAYSGIPIMWYEVSLKSDALSNAFKQNENIELGDETSWTVEALLKSGAIDDLARKAASIVKELDVVGYWNDNQQKELQHRAVANRKGSNVQDPEVFW